MKLDKLGVFPAESYIRVVWIGLQDDKHLIGLQKDVEEKLKEFYFRKDFEFLPHLTLTRVKFIKDKSKFMEKIEKIKIEPKEIEIKEFKLIKSDLTTKGPVYEDICVFKAESVSPLRINYF